MQAESVEIKRERDNPDKDLLSHIDQIAFCLSSISENLANWNRAMEEQKRIFANNIKNHKG